MALDPLAISSNGHIVSNGNQKTSFTLASNGFLIEVEETVEPKPLSVITGGGGLGPGEGTSVVYHKRIRIQITLPDGHQYEATTFVDDIDLSVQDVEFDNQSKSIKLFLSDVNAETVEDKKDLQLTVKKVKLDNYQEKKPAIQVKVDE